MTTLKTLSTAVSRATRSSSVGDRNSQKSTISAYKQKLCLQNYNYVNNIRTYYEPGYQGPHHEPWRKMKLMIFARRN